MRRGGLQAGGNPHITFKPLGDESMKALKKGIKVSAEKRAGGKKGGVTFCLRDKGQGGNMGWRGNIAIARRRVRGGS